MPRSPITNTLPLPFIHPFTLRDENLAVLCGADPSRSNNGPDPSKLIDPPKKLSDPYGWMRNEDRKDQEVLDHLNAENAYTKTVTGHLEVRIVRLRRRHARRRSVPRP